jgi:phage tail-like protein
MAVAGQASQPPARKMVKDPYANYRFAVKIGEADVHNSVCGFSEASGLGIETEVETFREGGNNLQEIQLAGPAKFPAKLVLKRGLAENHLWSWYTKIMKGEIQRKTVTIILQNYDGEAKWRWIFSKACPVKWTGPEFRAGTAEIAFEAIELVHEGLQSEGKGSGPV